MHWYLFVSVLFLWRAVSCWRCAGWKKKKSVLALSCEIYLSASCKNTFAYLYSKGIVGEWACTLWWRRTAFIHSGPYLSCYISKRRGRDAGCLSRLTHGFCSLRRVRSKTCSPEQRLWIWSTRQWSHIWQWPPLNSNRIQKWLCEIDIETQPIFLFFSFSLVSPCLQCRIIFCSSEEFSQHFHMNNEQIWVWISSLQYD